jgi:glycosyltransferase involved in cell wall biosynthesis
VSARRAKILTMIDVVSVSGGAENLAVEIATRLDSTRFESFFCSTRWAERSSDPLARGVVERLEACGVRFLGLERSGKADVGAWRPLLDLLRSERIDVLHSHKFGSNAWGAILSRIAKTPAFVAHEHTWSFEGQPLRKMIDRELIARRASAFVAVSELDRRRMIELERIPAEKIVLVPNGISPMPETDGAKVREELGIEPEVRLIGTVCSLRAQKALDVLVDVAASLRDDPGGVRVLIAGEGEERPRLEALIADRGLEREVTLLGRRADVPDVLAALDLALLTSDFEGTPLSVIEYMAAGLPVVATAVGGVPDLVQDGETGYLVEPRDAAAIAGRVRELLGDRERARRMGERARERSALFGIEATVSALQDLYAGLSSRTRGA